MATSNVSAQEMQPLQALEMAGTALCEISTMCAAMRSLMDTMGLDGVASADGDETYALYSALELCLERAADRCADPLLAEIDDVIQALREEASRTDARHE